MLNIDEALFAIENTTELYKTSTAIATILIMFTAVTIYFSHKFTISFDKNHVETSFNPINRIKTPVGYGNC
jgi:hypothetical protein